MNRHDVIDVLTVVAAATRRTVGDADVDIWQAVIGDLPKDLALSAVRTHLRDCPGVWLEPGHVYGLVRSKLRDQLEREPDEMREARQEALSAKAAEDIELLAQRKGVPGVKFSRRTGPNPLSVRCPVPWCHAAIGMPCESPGGGRPSGGSHPSRLELVA